jgi:DNA-binding LacI/PurR family transcriptional regulator
VVLDDTPGVRDVVAHLAALGHTRFAHVAGPSRMLHGERRARSFAAALAELGLPAGRIVETDFTAADGARATRELLDRVDRPTAIVYANDPMAIAGLGVAQRLGIEVPRELSITGFDGSDVGAYLHPALTTVTTAAQQWGHAAAELLLRVIDFPAVSVTDVVLPPATLVIRNSTAPPLN